ncbi:hypothetical protein HRbin17_02006 [bacterium HR17]|uniref:Uncharacterized protein n=1 Tax=Candidatus Fervidibacter japonicus TaxID=2035412 RepID=A0A2H5XE69_9BACT|nr:hypothetical protein HRbin17_02006 [bacterium HR17]
MRRRTMLVVATVLSIVSVIAPLLAGYCMNCVSGHCESGCTAVPTSYVVSYCVACQLPDGSFACTACDFQIYYCVREGYVCSSPPYIYVLIYEENKRQLYPPFSCVWVESIKRYRCQ